MSEFKTIKQAVNWLQQGNILAYPTESVWGIGCDAMNEEAVQQILTIKNRPVEKGMIVITDSVERIDDFLANLSKAQKQEVLDSWCACDLQNNNHIQNLNKNNNRQAITWLFPVPEGLNIPSWIRGQHNSLAIRVIAHPLIKKLCSEMVSETNPFGFIISTSCNPATYPPAKLLNEAQAYFNHQHDYEGIQNIGYLLADTLGYTMPSKIKDVINGNIIR